MIEFGLIVATFVILNKIIQIILTSVLAITIVIMLTITIIIIIIIMIRWLKRNML